MMKEYFSKSVYYIVTWVCDYSEVIRELPAKEWQQEYAPLCHIIGQTYKH